MILIFLFMLMVVAFVGGLVVFAAGFVFIRKPSPIPNRFGESSPTSQPVSAVISGVRRMFDFRDRANRLDFWIFAVFIVLVGGSCLVATVVLLIINRDQPTWWSALPLTITPFLALASLSMAVRRLHDINRSGWWVLLLLVFGYFILLYWFVQPSQRDERINVF